jgi:hypothetical protein
MSTQAQASNPGRAIPDVPLAKHINHTPFPSQYFQNVDKNGVVFHVVVVRVTYDMHHLLADGSLSYAAEQTPLATQDVWSGEVNVSSPLWESDFAPFKPRCDILVVNAVSRPPQGQTTQRWPCGVALTWQQDGQPQQLKTWSKPLTVTGPRSFKMLGLSQPEATTEVPIDWQHAYGGETDKHTDERNPVGVGLNKASGQAAPQLELMGKPYTDGYGQNDYPPICLSALGRAWLPRRLLAGTYDDAWLKTQWPLPPVDFDNGYWNCAPQDQQVEHLPPGVEILLADLYPRNKDAGKTMDAGTWRGKLPQHQLFDLAYYSDIPGHGVQQNMNLDTLVVDMATQQIYATYRSLRHASQLSASLVLETRMTAATGSDQSVPTAELGPLG